MIKPKDLIVKPIGVKPANKFIKKHHYSGSVMVSSQIHLGVFYGKVLYGVMSFGHCINRRGTLKLVTGTKWNGFIELNRMAFLDSLPKNSESRCIGYAMRFLKKHYKQLDWVISFADGCQCGNGTIYRASGFKLVEIKKNDQLRVNPKTGEVKHTLSAYMDGYRDEFNEKWKILKGHQFKYIYLLKPNLEKNLSVPIIPFDKLPKTPIPGKEASMT